MTTRLDSMDHSLGSRGRFDAAAAAGDFPALDQRIGDRPLVYLDNAATTQKPRDVIDAVARYYENDNANIHRGVHALSVRATDAFESARSRVASFVGASSEREVVFVRGATEGINLVASSFGDSTVGPGDEIIVTTLEHHSNIVPWQMVCEQSGARLRVLPINERGELQLDRLGELLTERTRIVALAHISNALGTINPIEAIAAAAHRRGALVLIDGAQGAPHLAIDVQALGPDFYLLSGHKAFGPTGIGILWGRREVLADLPPYQGGGDMIRSVTFERTTYNELPHKFEAGTPNIAGVVGLAAAFRYLDSLGMDAIGAHESRLLAYGEQVLAEVEGLRFIGTAADKASVISFVMEGIHPHDVGTLLDQEGIAVRTGHHCAQPVMDFFGVPATARASLAFYNTTSELDRLADGLRRVREVFGR